MSRTGHQRACRNEVEQVDGSAPRCTGTLTFHPGDVQAACDTCGGWEGVDAPGHEPLLERRRCPRSRRGRKQQPHEPHTWWADFYPVVGDLGYEARCPGWPLPQTDSSSAHPSAAGQRPDSDD